MAEAGWTRATAAEAEALAGSILDAWGDGDYTTARRDVWGERHVGLWAE